MFGSSSTIKTLQPLPKAAFYGDAYLYDLINQALEGNQELRILAEEIQIANYETYARSGEYRPFVNGGVGVGIDKQGRYPSLNLTGGLGWNAFSTGYLFQTPQSLMYGVGADLVGPLINKRAIQAAYSTANAKQLQAIYNYQQTVLQAHIEVVNYLTKVENYRRSIEGKKQQLQALEASVDAATNLFQNARAEYVEVLLAQRELMEARMLLIDTKQEQLAAVINAYQALGGGWR
jgi:outer membrane protein TolC